MTDIDCDTLDSSRTVVSSKKLLKTYVGDHVRIFKDRPEQASSQERLKSR